MNQALQRDYSPTKELAHIDHWFNQRDRMSTSLEATLINPNESSYMQSGRLVLYLMLTYDGAGDFEAKHFARRHKFPDEFINTGSAAWEKYRELRSQGSNARHALESICFEDIYPAIGSTNLPEIEAAEQVN